MSKMIAFCGLTCNDCPTFKATLRNDDDRRAKIAKAWSKEYGVEIKPGEINCDGCLSKNGRLFTHCKVCDIRKCGQEKNLDNCGHCPDFACQKLDFVFQAVPEAREKLQKIKDNQLTSSP